MLWLLCGRGRVQGHFGCHSSREDAASSWGTEAGETAKRASSKGRDGRLPPNAVWRRPRNGFLVLPAPVPSLPVSSGGLSLVFSATSIPTGLEVKPSLPVAQERMGGCERKPFHFSVAHSPSLPDYYTVPPDKV